jgi:hypothetical protein
MVKPGYKTTEFAGAIASVLITILVLVGVVQEGEHKELEEALIGIITALAVVASNAAVLVAYIRSRTALKAEEAARLRAMQQ